MSHGDEIKRVYDDPVRFAIDAGIEVVGAPVNVARLVQSSVVTFAALYNGGSVDADVSRDGGDLTGTPFGGAATNGVGQLDLTGGTIQAVDYDPVLNVDQIAKVGTLRMRWIPDFTGTPAAALALFDIRKVSNAANRITIALQNTGFISLTVNANNGSTIIAVNMGLFSAVAGVLTEWELSLDVDTGNTILRVDGVRTGLVRTETGNRSTDITAFTIGSLPDHLDPNDILVDEFSVFDSIQHTADYTPGAEGLIFTKDNPTIKSASTTLVKQVLSFATVKAIDNPLSLDTITHLYEVDGVPLRFDGAAWILSDQSTPASRLAESNTEEEMNDNAGLLPLNPLGSLLRVVNVFHSDDGITTPTLTTTTVGVSFDVADEIPPPECIVTGIEQTAEGDPLEGIPIVVTQEGFFHGAFHQPPRTFEQFSGPDGKWQIQLVETATLGLLPDREPYTFRINADRFSKIQIPNLASELFGNIRALPDV